MLEAGNIRAEAGGAMDPAVLSWDNVGNSQWLNSGKGSWIQAETEIRKTFER